MTNRDAPVAAFVDGEHLEQRRVHRCGVVDEHGRPCPTWTLQPKCHKHRRQEHQKCSNDLLEAPPCLRLRGRPAPLVPAHARVPAA